MISTSPWFTRIEKRLSERHQQHLTRQRYQILGPQGVSINIDGQQYTSFCSNDYLGLANHPSIISSFTQAAEKYGVGSGASHLISGHSSAHHQLEEELADFTGRQRALLFSTGYMANMGVMSALLNSKDLVLNDRLNHASLLDASKLSGAKMKRYLHNDVGSLQNKIGDKTEGNTMIATDGVFSMDGDIAPLPEIVAVADKNNALLLVDDAHGIGVLGKEGQGTLAHYNLSESDVPILMGTLGKSLGVFGAFVAGSEALIESLIQFARSYIYTTALPPAVAEAARTSLAMVKSENWRREKLNELTQQFKLGAQLIGLTVLPSETPIQAVIIPDNKKLVSVCDKLEEQGIWVRGIRSPTVAKGSERIRITFSATHSEQDIDRLLLALDSIVI